MTLILAMFAAVQVAAPVPAGVQPTALAASPVQADEHLRRRADDVLTILRGGGDYDVTFAPAFRAAVPKAQVDGIAAQVAAALGQPTGVESVTPTGPWAGRVRIGYERGVLNLDLAIDPAEPHLVTGLLTKGAEPRVAETSVDAVLTALATLPGRTNFTLAKLGTGAPIALAGRESATPLAIGSAFKLVVLAELVRSIAAGGRSWTDNVTLDGRPLPGGGYTHRAKGTHATLRALAERMISVSDNSATDILLYHLGRKSVEAMLPVVGMTDGGARNLPFLGTLELFKLKGIDKGTLGTRYLALPPARRRAFLDREVAAAPVSALPADLFQDGKPVRIAELEWFASADDLVRTMDWLRRHSDGPGGADTRAILSKNPGLTAPAGKWRYVGFKGGSEPGVLNLTFLMQGKEGGWYALSSSWNDPAAGVDTPRFTGLVGRALELAAPQ